MCFGFYVLYTRQPDFFDGETSPAQIHWMYDSAAQRTIPKAIFRHNLKNYAIDTRYVFRDYKEGKKLTVVFNPEEPEKGAVYAFWGYWIRWQEVIGSVVLLFMLFQVAVLITSNPTPEAVIDQMETEERKGRRYTD